MYNEVQNDRSRSAWRRRSAGSIAALSMLVSMAGVSSAIATDTAPISGTVDELQLPSGAATFTYVPDGLELVAWTTPILLVMNDEPFNATSAKEFAETTGLAEHALADNAVITFINSISDEWGADDLDSYDQVINRLYAERPNPATWDDGRLDGPGNGRSEEYPFVYQGYPHRISVIANGGAADFTTDYLVNDTLHLELDPAPVDWLTASVMLFNTDAVPDAEIRQWPAIITNGATATIEKYAELNSDSSHFYSGSSVITDDFDPDVIGEKYGQLTSVRRQQLGNAIASEGSVSNNVIWDIADFAALGVPPQEINLTLSPNREAMYQAYVPKSLDLTKDGTVPLVMLFHGSGERAEWIAMLSDWPVLAAEEGFIVVAVDDHGGQRTPGNMTTDQIMELMDDVYERYPAIDKSRVYATGFSMGSMRTINLGTQRPDVFAAIAPMHVTAAPTNTMDDLILPTMYMAGNEDLMTSVFPRHARAEYNGVLNNADRFISHLYDINDVRGGTYEYDASAVNPFWGIDFDSVETLPATNGTSVASINYLESADGNVYTALVNSTNLNHSSFPEYTPIAWDFMKQFSRNADGSLTITPDEEPLVATAVSRCVAGKSVLAVTLTNQSDQPIKAEIDTPFGTALVTVNPERSVSKAFSTRSAQIESNEIVITAEGDTIDPITVAFGAHTCN